MSPERWTAIETLFDHVLDLPAAERAAAVEAADVPDDVRREVTAMVGALGATDTFLESPASVAVADLVAVAEAAPPVERAGPWRLLKEVGRGGMGAVYRAERADGAFEQTAAVKLLRPGREGAEAVRRFRAERQILAGLDHPGIARLLDGGLADGPGGEPRPYLAMEYVDGRSIDAYCADEGLGVEARVRLVVDVCEAVHDAHRALVVHRDLKPSNVLVTGDGRVKLLDFGIAKLLTPDLASTTLTELPLMTPEYASPEQVSGTAITTASDVYQLGLLLYELLTGRRPYAVEGLGLSAFARAVLEAAPARPSLAATDPGAPPAGAAPPPLPPDALARRLRGDLDAILLKALRKEPDARYASAEALAADLRRWLDGQPVAAHRGSTAYRVGKFGRRHRAGVAVAAVAVVAVVAAGLLYNVRVAAERDRAEAAAATSEHVADYLVGLFREGQRGGMSGSVVREASLALLEPAADRLAADLADEPAARARLSLEFGELFWSLGQYGRAETLLEASLALRDSLPDVPPADLARSLRVAGEFVGYIRGDHPRAVDLLTRAEALYETVPDAALDLARTRLFLGRTLPASDPRKTAYQDRALAAIASAHGERSVEVGVALHELHAPTKGVAVTPEQIVGLRRAAALLETAGDPFQAATVLETLGLGLWEVGDTTGVGLLDRAYHGLRETAGASDYYTLRVGANYGLALVDLGRAEEGERLVRGVVDDARAAATGPTTALGHALYAHGSALLALGRPAEAAVALAEARQIWGDLMPQNTARLDEMDDLLRRARPDTTPDRGP